MSPLLLAKCVEDALSVRSDLYCQTLEAGRHLRETTTEPECRSRLQSELQAVQEAWERTISVLEQRRDLHHTSVQVSQTSTNGQLELFFECKLIFAEKTNKHGLSYEKLITNNKYVFHIYTCLALQSRTGRGKLGILQCAAVINSLLPKSQKKRKITSFPLRKAFSGTSLFFF